MVPKTSSLPASIHLNLHMATRQSISSSTQAPAHTHLQTPTDRLLARGCGWTQRPSEHFYTGVGRWKRVVEPRHTQPVHTRDRCEFRSHWIRRSPFRAVRYFINGLSLPWTDLMDHLSRAFLEAGDHSALVFAKLTSLSYWNVFG